jgi:NADH-quinone oxidoreductase subunit H
MNIAEYLIPFLVFPGFLFSAAAGLMVSWVDRKVTAAIQWREGPPWYQSFLDIAKLLLYKETLIPKNAPKGYFFGMPLLALSAATLASTILLSANGNAGAGFIGDVIVVVYLLMIPSVALMLGAFASANTLASVGGSREMKIMLSYELPFLLALSVPIIKSGYALRLGDIINYQVSHGAIAGNISGMLSLIAMIFCVQAKLGLVPFDMAEAETEIMSGTCIEYSGKALAMFKLSKSVMAFAVPALIVMLYCGGFFSGGVPGFIWCSIQYSAVTLILILIKNTNPRVRIDHAMRFFWGPVAILAALSSALAIMGY